MRPCKLQRLPKANNNHEGPPVYNPPINNEQQIPKINESQVKNIDSDYIRKE